MVNFLYNSVLLYGIELLKLMMFCFGLLGIKMVSPKKSVPLCILSFVSAAAASCFLNEGAADFVYGLIAVVVSVLAAAEKKKAPMIILTYLYVCVLDMIIYGIISSIVKFELDTAIMNKGLNIMLNSLALIVIIPLSLYSVRKKKVFHEGLSIVNILLLSLGGVALALSLTISLLVFGNNISDKYARIAQVCMSFIGLVFIACAFLLVSGRIKNELLKSENSNAWHIMKAQETYYKMLLQREEETRAFRHDIQNHLNCLSMLYQDMKWPEFEKYLEDLNNAFHDIKKVTETGNKIVNSIVSDIISKHHDVKYAWKGCLPEEFNITPMQVCTIFSNLISNAFEAAEKVENGDVCIEVRNIGTSVVVLISNASKDVPKKINGKLVSSKTEEHHGFGIGNVIKVLNSLNGSFRMEAADSRVSVEVIIPGAFNI